MWIPSSEEHQRPQSWGEAPSADTVRSGEAESLFLTFTVYEARNSTFPDSASSWAVIGPDWGASVRPWFPIALGDTLAAADTALVGMIVWHTIPLGVQSLRHD